jgi:ribonuclease HII
MLELRFQNKLIEAGVDEAGRGCLAGPVFAAAVILPKKFKSELLNDSKQLSEKKREELRPIIEGEALAWAVGIATHEEIDKINILNASYLAMHRAIEQLKKAPQLLLIDGNRFKKYKEIPFKCIIKGDGKYMSIAAASILAKTHRDEYMMKMDEAFPHYQWRKNKGYGTLKHRMAIEQHGESIIHRKSFKVVPLQPTLF